MRSGVSGIQQSLRALLRIVAATWIAAAGVGLLFSLAWVITPWVNERAVHGGEAAVPPAMWLVVDYLLPVWMYAASLLLALMVVASLVAWPALRAARCSGESNTLRRVLIACLAMSSVGVVGLAVMHLPWGARLLTRSLCDVESFESAISPDGRYKASVIQVDCGAMTGFNRQVVINRRPFDWSPSLLMRFNESPALHLAWSGRTLTITGDRARASLEHPPPDPMIWGGVLARYLGPGEL